MLNITHSESGNGKTYANISGITPLPAALKNQKPEAVHANQIFTLDQPDMSIYESLPKWLQDKIAESPEFANAGPSESSQESYDEEDFSDVPF